MMNLNDENDEYAVSKRLGFFIIAFICVNLLSPFLFCFIPIVIPIWIAEFLLLLIWSAFGIGHLWIRFLFCFTSGLLLLMAQLAFGLMVAEDPRSILNVFLFVVPMWIVAHVPLWFCRFVLKWRFSSYLDDHLRPLRLIDIMTGVTILSVAFGCLNGSRFLTNNWLTTIPSSPGATSIAPAQLVAWEYGIPVVLGTYMGLITAAAVYHFDRKGPNSGFLRFTILAVLLPIGATYFLIPVVVWWVVLSFCLLIGSSVTSFVVFGALTEIKHMGLCIRTRIEQPLVPASARPEFSHNSGDVALPE